MERHDAHVPPPQRIQPFQGSLMSHERQTTAGRRASEGHGPKPKVLSSVLCNRQHQASSFTFPVTSQPRNLGLRIGRQKSPREMPRPLHSPSLRVRRRHQPFPVYNEHLRNGLNAHSRSPHTDNGHDYQGSNSEIRILTPRPSSHSTRTERKEKKE